MALLRSVASSLRRSAAAVSDVHTLRQGWYNIPAHWPEYALDLRRTATSQIRASSSGNDGVGKSNGQERDQGCTGNVEPNIVAASLLVDTLQLMKKFEDHAGLNRQQAEALTKHLTQLLLYQTQFTKDNFVTKEQLHRLNIQMEAHQKQFRQEMQVAHEVHHGTVSKDAERMSGQLDTFKSEIKHDVDKLTANQKLDLNLERGRLRDDLQQLRDRLTTLRTSLEREVNLVRTDIEASKSDTLKWVIVTVVGLLGAGFAAIRLSLA